jgi:hypothetical protein
VDSVSLESRSVVTAKHVTIVDFALYLLEYVLELLDLLDCVLELLDLLDYVLELLDLLDCVLEPLEPDSESERRKVPATSTTLPRFCTDS